jgi:hypothetical protein
MHPGFAKIFAAKAKGPARRKAQSDLVSCSVAGTRERLSARHTR